MKIGERGQITIPKKLREKYGLMPNIEVDLLPIDIGLIIKKKMEHKSPIQRVYGILNKHQNTDTIIEEMRGE